MTPDELVAHKDVIFERHAKLSDIVDSIESASDEIESSDQISDAYAEALFLRAFTAYENDLEKLFLHYVTGGATLQGKTANTYLNVADEQLARKLTRAGFKFLAHRGIVWVLSTPMSRIRLWKEALSRHERYRACCSDVRTRWRT